MIALTSLKPLELQAVMISSLLLQRHTILKSDENFFPDVIADPDVKHSDIINFAIKNAEFKDVNEYFHLRNEVFYVDSLIENVELDVAVNIATRTSKKYSEYTKEELIKEVIQDPLSVKARNEEVGKLLKVTIPLRERKFIDYLKQLTEVDFKEEISIAANNICRLRYNQDTKYYRFKGELIYRYVMDYLKSPEVQKILQDDPYNITKYFLSLTTSILMESLKYSSEGGLGIFDAGHTGKVIPLGIKIGLDDDEIDIPNTKRQIEMPSNHNTIEDIDALLNSLKK